MVSRQAGKEALAAFQPSLKDVAPRERVEIDFEGVITFSPSWGDEFLTPLQKQFGEKLILKNTKNPSVQMTLELLEKINSKKITILF